MSLRDTEPGRRTNPPEGAWRKPCADFADVLPLLHDHELGPAEAAELEMHLSECGLCSARADAYERLSSVLKRWDAEEAQPAIPHLRMQHAVLARVAEHGAHRRAADRSLRLVRWATAACVVLALGVAIVAGLSFHDRDEFPGATSARADASASPARVAFDALDPLADPLADVGRFDPRDAPLGSVSSSDWMQAPLPALPSEPDWPNPQSPSRSSVQSLARLQALQGHVNELARRIDGEATIWFGIDARGMHRIGSDALDYLHDSGILAQLQLEMQRAHRKLETTSSPTPVVGRAVERPRDVLAGLPGLTRRSMDLLDGMPFARRIPGLTIGGMQEHRLRGYGLKTQEGGTTWIDAADPIQAQAQGRLRFAETHRFDLVVAFVRAGDKPIFIPDGQLLVRGAKDRVIAEPVWLPASKTAMRYTIRCRVVQRGRRRENPLPPVLSEWIAGPTMRSLLRRKAEDTELLDVISAQLRIADPIRFEGTFRPWSLADLPQAMRLGKSTFAEFASRTASDTRKSFIESKLQGFVAEGDSGAREQYLCGIEITRIPGAAGAALLSRLYFSYALESALMVEMRTHVALGSFHRPAPRGAAYQRLNLGQRGMDEHTSVRLTHRLRALRQQIEVVDQRPIHVEVLDVDGTPVLVSVTSEGARERP